MIEDTKKQPKNEIARKPGKYDPVPINPLDRAAPGENKVVRKENRQQVLGGDNEIAQGLDFDVFGT